MRPLILAIVAVALMVAPSLAQKSYTGTATGDLIVDSKSIPIRYAYAVDVNDVEDAGLMQDEPQRFQVLVLSDRPLPLASVADRNAPYSDRHSPGDVLQPLKKGVMDKIYGLLLKIDPARKAVYNAEFYYPGKDTLSVSVAGTQYPDRITGLKREGGFLTGTAVLATAQTTGLEKGPHKYRYRVTFRAPVLSETPVKEQLEGQAALDSAPVATIKAYVAAGKKGDLDTLRKLTAESHQPYLKNADFVKSLQNGDMESIPAQVRRVVVRGETATVVLVNEKPTYSQVSMNLVRENGEWRLYWP